MSGTKLGPSSPVTQTTTGKGSFGAAVEWLLMVVLMLYVCHLINVYQSESLPAPLSKEQAGPHGFFEVTAREHIMSLVEFGPHLVGTEALDKALMVSLQTFMPFASMMSYDAAVKDPAASFKGLLMVNKIC
ncbi:unnamed protein product [Calypogeia fissa]